jgi:uncharacterized protein (DUF58 family)
MSTRAAKQVVRWRFEFYRRLLNYLWSFKLTQEGKVMFAAGAFAGAFGSFSLDTPLAHLFTAIAMLLGVCVVAGWIKRPRIKMVHGFPEKAVSKRPFTVPVELRNTCGRRLYDISAGLFYDRKSEIECSPAKGLAVLQPGERGRVELTINPLSRGYHLLPALRPYTSFPFNLMRVSGRPAALRPLLVLPAFDPLESFTMPAPRRYQPGGIAFTSDVGESTEYIGNREYIEGDSLRNIDFRSWARLGKPHVREFQEEYFSRIGLVLDTHFVTAQGAADFEAAVSLTAAIVDALGRGEHVIDLFAAGPELHIFRAGRHIAHFDSVLEVLACVEASKASPFSQLIPTLADELPAIGALAAIFLDWDEERQALVHAATEAGCAVRVLIVRSEAPSLQPQGEEALIEYLDPGSITRGEVTML